MPVTVRSAHRSRVNREKVTRSGTMKQASWTDQIFHVTHLILLSSPTVLQDYMSQTFSLTDELRSDNCAGLARDVMGPDGLIIVYWFNRDVIDRASPSQRIPYMCHEASHGVDMVFHHRGLGTKRSVTEVRAYYLDHIVTGMIEAFHVMLDKKEWWR